jgi:two-component system, NtrC family, response regulator AtoC
VKSFLLVLAVIRHSETRSLVRMVLEGAGHRVIEAEDYPQAQSLLGNRLDPDLMLVEAASEGAPENLQYLRLLECARAVPVCLIAGMAQNRAREEAHELGIRHFLIKPVTRGDVESMVDELRSDSASGAAVPAGLTSAQMASLSESNAAQMPPVPLIEELGDSRYFLAASPSMLEIYRQAMLLADIDVTVLILGESGTGKEVIANLIHNHSRRSKQPLLNVNCAALPAELLESELFGHRQGAFTGAIRDRAGRFEQANRGTLLLDEIGEISAQMQAKLLHVLQDGQFTRLGGQESTRVDVRILAATNVEMETALEEKTFREDLYYRLSAFTIHVPPLRERREEIPYLIDETIRRTPAEMRSGGNFSPSSRLIDAALLYDWRGNLRELRNFVTRTIIMRDQDVAIRELETKIAARDGSTREQAAEIGPAPCSGMRSVVRDLKDRTEVRMIQEALDASGWNRRHAAQNLNISYRALLYKIQQHRLAPRMARGMN